MSASPAFHIVIPARYASERLPGKPTLDVAGKSLVERVWRRALGAAAVSVLIATDDERVERLARGFGAETLLTDPAHASGSDRIAECAQRLGWGGEEIVVNLQGDEPLMPPACLEQVAALAAADPGADAASLWWPIDDAAEVDDPNVVKVVVDGEGRALYFSRAAVPHARGLADSAAALRSGVRYRRHIGLYAYRVGTLERFTRAPVARLEAVEKLEQLRILEWGGRIVMARAAEPIPAGVDTPADLERVRKLFR